MSKKQITHTRKFLRSDVRRLSSEAIKEIRNGAFAIEREETLKKFNFIFICQKCFKLRLLGETR